MMLGFIFAICLCGFTVANGADKTGGTFEKFDFEPFVLHVFTTTEGPGDVTYIFETNDTLVLFELPSIHHLSRQLKEYSDKLNKPVAAILAGYHVGGASYYPGVPVYASQTSLDFIDSGGEMALRKAIAATNPDFDLEVPRPENVVTGEKQTIGGIEFIFITPTTSPVPGMNIIIPSINAYYQHVLGGNSHPILKSVNHIDQVIAELQGQQAGNYALMLDSHNGVEQPSAIAQKIVYLEKLKEIRRTSKDEAAFINAMKTAFPHYSRERALTRTARNLFQ